MGKVERRQRFAEIAMKYYLETADVNRTQEEVAEKSFRMADIMLKEEVRSL